MTIEKISTGIHGLDQIMKGGYLKNKPTLIKGSPGVGKTIFTLFFAYAQIKAKNKVIYVTCDESPEQIISHMDNFEMGGSQFLKEGKIAVLDFTPVFNDEVAGEFNLNALLLRIEQAKKKSKAPILIIDSLQSLLLGIGNYNLHFELLRLFQWARNENLTLLTTIADTKTILKTEIYEEYVVDCAIELKQRLTNNLMTRYLRVIKFRGSSHGTNEYPFSIIHNGISLIPVSEAKLESTLSTEYYNTGIKGLDDMLDNKGYQIGASVMVSGRSGTAKTLFAASFAQSALKHGKKVLYISFEEASSHLLKHLKSINVDLDPFIEKKTLLIHSRSSVEMGLEDHIISIIEMADRGKFDVIILDPISSLLDMGSLIDIKMLFIRFIFYLKSCNRTLFFTELLPDFVEDKSKLGLSSMTEVWIRLSRIESNGEFNRLVHIAKARGIKTSNQVKEFLITNKGIQIEEPYLGEKEMVFGSKKAAYILKEKQNEIQRQQESEQLESELRSLEEELLAQQKINEVGYLAKKNELMRKKSKLLYQDKEIKARRETNKLLRD